MATRTILKALLSPVGTPVAAEAALIGGREAPHSSRLDPRWEQPLQRDGDGNARVARREDAYGFPTAR